ncbi:MAG: hypothetical protein KIG49_06875, partial [Eubacteriales bacterium]|nr:hypothetical protein [Eubacteriales bacterium]
EHGIVDGSTYVKSDIWGGKRAANYYLGGDILRIGVCIALDDELMPADYRRIFFEPVQACNAGVFRKKAALLFRRRGNESVYP